MKTQLNLDAILDSYQWSPSSVESPFMIRLGEIKNSFSFRRATSESFAVQVFRKQVNISNDECHNRHRCSGLLSITAFILSLYSQKQKQTILTWWNLLTLVDLLAFPLTQPWGWHFTSLYINSHLEFVFSTTWGKKLSTQRQQHNTKEDVTKYTINNNHNIPR